MKERDVRECARESVYVCVCHGGCDRPQSATAVPSFISEDNLGLQSLPRLLVSGRMDKDAEGRKEMDG